MHKISGDLFICTQDSTKTHRAHEVINLLACIAKRSPI